MTDIYQILIKRVADGIHVPADLLDGIDDDRQVDDWVTFWRPAQRELLAQLISAGVPRQDWPQTAHWNWPKKLDAVSGLLSHRSLSVVCDGKTQALMRLDVTTRRAVIPEQLGLHLVYVDFVEKAPWNWDYPKIRPPLYKEIGTQLMVAAVRISIAEGFNGRLGLDSLPQADGFYRRLGMTDLGPSTSSPHLRYFEFTSKTASLFLERSQ